MILHQQDSHSSATLFEFVVPIIQIQYAACIYLLNTVIHSLSRRFKAQTSRDAGRIPESAAWKDTRVILWTDRHGIQSQTCQKKQLQHITQSRSKQPSSQKIQKYLLAYTAKSTVWTTKFSNLANSDKYRRHIVPICTISSQIRTLRLHSDPNQTAQCVAAQDSSGSSRRAPVSFSMEIIRLESFLRCPRLSMGLVSRHFQSFPQLFSLPKKNKL